MPSYKIKLTTNEYHRLQKRADLNDLSISGCARSMLDKVAGGLTADTQIQMTGKASEVVQVSLNRSTEQKLSRFVYERLKKPLCQNTLSGLLRPALVDREIPCETNDATEREAFPQQCSQLETHINQFFSRNNLTSRPQQVELIHNLVSGHRASMNEASTGIGKTAAQFCAAEYLLDQQNVRVAYIAVPTVKLMRQVKESAREYGIPVQAISSRFDYLSFYALHALIDSAESSDDKAFLEHLLDRQDWSIGSLDDDDLSRLKSIGNGFCDLATPDDDPGYIQSIHDRETVSHQGVVIVTHSMLALSLWRTLFGKEGALQRTNQKREADDSKPATYSAWQSSQRRVSFGKKLSYGEYLLNAIEQTLDDPWRVGGRLAFGDDAVLFVDEAHLFRRYAELACTQEVSISALCRSASRFHHRIDSKHLDNLHSLAVELDADAPDKYNLGVARQYLPSLQYFSALKLRKAKPSDTYFISRIHRAASLLCHFITRPSPRINVSVSKVRKYVRVSSTPPSLPIEACLYMLNHASLFSSSHYLSATLDDGSGRYLSIKGELSAKNAYAFPTLTSEWLRDSVSVSVHKIDVDDYDSIAGVIRAQRELHNGGILVLLTSYHAIHALSERLGDFTLVTESPSASREFETLYLAGNKPIYLATGAAWTGLDLTDRQQDAVDDNMIQSLVIPRLPYAPLETPEKRVPFHIARSNALLMFKQGMGRLVRRAGRENMNLIVTDHRIFDRAHSGFLKMLTQYRHVALPACSQNSE